MQKSPSLQFFDSALENFFAAVSRVEELSFCYRLAGFTFCLRFAGKAMVEKLTLAISHLKIDAVDRPDLTIYIWDRHSTNAPALKIPWPKNSYAIRGEVFRYNSERIHTVLDVHTSALNVFDRDQGAALYWIEDSRSLPWWVMGSPLQLILNWWMQTKGFQLTHAAAVGHTNGGVILAGKGGAGKSTTTLSCMKRGMKYVSEDYCLVGDLPKIDVYSVYNSAKIKNETLIQFPELEKKIENKSRSKEEKAFLFHQRFQPQKILSHFPLKAVITLKIQNERDSKLELIDPKEALAPLTVSTLWQLTHSGPSVVNHLKRVVSALPCYLLSLGGDWSQPPRLIEELLKR